MYNDVLVEEVDRSEHVSPFPPVLVSTEQPKWHFKPLPPIRPETNLRPPESANEGSSKAVVVEETTIAPKLDLTHFSNPLPPGNFSCLTIPFPSSRYETGFHQCRHSIPFHLIPFHSYLLYSPLLVIGTTPIDNSVCPFHSFIHSQF